MNKKPQFRINLKSKHLLAIMTIVCLVAIVGTFASGVGTEQMQETAGLFVVPFQKGIEHLSGQVENMLETFREKKALVEENDDLRFQLENLMSENNKLLQDQTELTDLQELYQLDQEYGDFPKVAARIISKDPGNWYDTFMINKGSNDGIRVDNNVIAGKGLVGIVTNVGPNWSTVRSIIDDASHVSAMTVSTQDNLVVEGDLELIDEGKLRFVQLYDQENKVTAGERIITSNISEKYVEGLFIGYVSGVEQDTNNLTKVGTIISPVDFRHLRDILVITINKQDILSEE